MDDLANEHTNEWKNERMNESERMNEWTNGG